MRGCLSTACRCRTIRHGGETSSAVNIQINMAHCIRYYAAFHPQIIKLAKLAQHRIVAAMRPAEREFDGVTFQAEPFRTFYRDAEPLIREHCAETEQAPDDHERLNLPLLQALDDIGRAADDDGALQRQGVRIPAFNRWTVTRKPAIVHGTHTAFYTSPAIRGLGITATAGSERCAA